MQLGTERQRLDDELRLFQKASTMNDKERVYIHFASGNVEGMKTSAISMATRIVSTLWQLVQSTTPAVTRPTRKLVQLTWSWHIVLVVENISCVIIHHRLFLCSPWSLCDRLLRIEGKICALILMEKLLLLQPMHSKFLRLLWNHG